jgi:uncharacterized protein (DUF433 family)
MRTLDGNTESTRGQIGQGIYSLAELRLYVAYYGKPGDGELALTWLTQALNPVAHQPRLPDYSFADLISLFVVRELKKLGVKSWRIREAEAYMRTRFGTDRPFVSEEVVTDGTRVFIRSEIDEQIELANRGGGQQVSHEVMRPYLRNVMFSDGWATSWSPLEHVVLDPQVQFGEPVIAGTRIQTEVAAEVVERFGAEQAVGRLGITLPAARSALEFEHRLSALRN